MMHTQIRFICLLLITLLVPAWADDDVELILRVKPTDLRAVLRAYDLELEETLPGQNVYLVEWEADDDDEDGEEDLARLLTRMRRDPRVIHVEINQTLQIPVTTPGAPLPLNPAVVEQALANRQPVNFFGAPTLRGFVEQPTVHRIELDDVRRLAVGTGIVAVIDTGVDPQHPLLRDRLLPGYDFVRDQPGASEIYDLDSNSQGVITQEAAVFLEGLRGANLSSFSIPILTQEAAVFLEGSRPPSAFGHGTMVAGLIRLTAPGAYILPLKAFNGQGNATLFNLIRALYYAADQQARVVNMSFTITNPSPEFQRAIETVAARGLILVAAAGNDGLNTLVYPAAYPAVIGVGATDAADNRSTFSNYGPGLLSLVAPGEGLITAYPGGYAAAWGTSFSAPLVSATVTLLEQVRPGATLPQLLDALSQAKPIAQPGSGAGRLDVEAALERRLLQP